MARREIYRNLPAFEPFHIVSLDFDNFVPFTVRSCAISASLFQEAHIFHQRARKLGRVLFAENPGTFGFAYNLETGLPILKPITANSYVAV